jgi:hypothetical protein
LFALGSPCANDENAMHVAIADMQMIRPNLIDTSRLLANKRLRAGNRRADEKSIKARGFASAN